MTEFAPEPNNVPGAQLPPGLAIPEATVNVAEVAHSYIDTALALGNMVAEHATPDSPFGTTEIADKTEKAVTFNNVVPSFSEQRQDSSRTNLVTYIAGAKASLGSHADYSKSKRTLSEHAMLNELGDFLERAVASPALDELGHVQARSMLETMTFIGEKEYDQAVEGIANHWRQQLTEDPGLKLCINSGSSKNGEVNSEAHLLDKVLSQFSDDELASFQGRLTTYPKNIPLGDQDTKIIILDDWSVSGQQLEDIAGDLKDYWDEGIPIEVQLIAASPLAIKHGATFLKLPVRAYFQAREATAQSPMSGIHLSGSHSSVDYGFDNVISNFAGKLGEDMPAGTNIVRSYRNGQVLTQRARLHEQPS